LGLYVSRVKIITITTNYITVTDDLCDTQETAYLHAFIKCTKINLTQNYHPTTVQSGIQIVEIQDSAANKN